MAKANIGYVLKTGIILAVYVVAFTLLMVITYEATKEDIANNQYQEKMALIAETLPKAITEKTPEFHPLTIAPDALLKTTKETTAYQAVINDRISAVVLETVAKGGYGGDIRLLVAIAPDLTILGVRVLEHHETPSIGDYIAEKPTDKKPEVWMNQFNGRSLENPTEDQWQIKKDGGLFDYVAGATVSARAMAPAIKQTLQYTVLHREQLFQN